MPALWNHAARCAAVAIALSVQFNLAGAHAAIIYVDDTAPSGGNGTKWSKAYRSLRTALNSAEAGDVVRVGRGTYRPSSSKRTTSFVIPDGVIVQGGYKGYGSSNPNALNPSAYRTILSGDLDKDDEPNFSNYGDNSYHVVTFNNVGPQTELRGVTIERGNASLGDHDDPHSGGAGIRIIGDSNPTISNCRIRRNRAKWFGGGIHAPEGAPTLIDCTIRDNMAVLATSGQGAGVKCAAGTFDDCIFLNNEGGFAVTCGGGIHGGTITVTNCTFKSNGSAGVVCGDDSIIRDCDFKDNSAEDGGGLTSVGANVAVIDCLFDGNTSASFGGGFFGQLGSSSTLINCIFRGNSSSAGNAVANRGSLTMVNCLLRDNHMDFGNGGIGAVYNFDGDMHIINCTIGFNDADTPGAGVYVDSGFVTIDNSILWRNGGSSSQGAQVFVSGGGVTVNFSCVEGWNGSMAGQGTFASNPDFDDEELRLEAGSPARDAANPGALPADVYDIDGDGDTNEVLPLDLDGEDRMAGGGVDAGAYEF